jgi:hypothetical protein
MENQGNAGHIPNRAQAPKVQIGLTIAILTSIGLGGKHTRLKRFNYYFTISRTFNLASAIYYRVLRKSLNTNFMFRRDQCQKSLLLNARSNRYLEKRRVFMKSTIQDVARHARFSIGKVSNSLTGKRPAAEATYQRRLAAMEELCYQPNRMARGLVNQRSYVLSIVIKELSDLGFYGYSSAVTGFIKHPMYLFNACPMDLSNI